MRIKDLLTVPEGQKVTEKHLRRVLISSICSILLCMTCLVSTTWAWFTVSIENTGNVIQIGKPEVIVMEGNVKLSSGVTLEAEKHTVQIEHANKLDDLKKKSTLYVTLTVRSGDAEEGTAVTKVVYVTLNHDNNYRTEVTVTSNLGCTLSWEVTWFAPDGAAELTGDTIDVSVEEPTEPPTDESAEALTEESTDSSEETNPTEQTSSTEETKDPEDTSTEPSTDPSEGADESEPAETQPEVSQEQDDQDTSGETGSGEQDSSDEGEDETDETA